MVFHSAMNCPLLQFSPWYCTLFLTAFLSGNCESRRRRLLQAMKTKLASFPFKNEYIFCQILKWSLILSKGKYLHMEFSMDLKPDSCKLGLLYLFLNSLVNQFVYHVTIPIMVTSILMKTKGTQRSIQNELVVER